MMEKIRRSSGMYFLKVGNQVASEGEEKKEAKQLGELGIKKRGHWGLGRKKRDHWRELGIKKRDHWGRKAYRKYVVCHARFFKIFP